MYPNIHNYLEAITDKYGSFRTLKSVLLPINESGRPYMISGNFSVIFKVVIDDCPKALKCYTRRCCSSASTERIIADYLAEHRSNDTPFVQFEILENELYVFDDYGRGDWYSVVVMDWIEGETLGCAIRRACKTGDQSRLRSLTAEFDRMSLWLKTHNCAHGDLKFDNIVVADSGKMTLVDYDGLFVPGINAKYSCELGTRDFQHPLRDILEFGEHIDDYSIVVISTTLHAVADFPGLFGEADWTTTPLFDDQTTVDYLTEQWLNSGDTHLVQLVGLLDTPTPEIDDLPSLLRNMDTKRTPIGELQMFGRAGKFGYEDSVGEVIAPIFDMAEEFVGQYALVRFSRRTLIINTQGKVCLDLSQYKYVEIYEEAVVRVSDDSTNWEFLKI